MKIAFLNVYQNAVNRGVEAFVSELSKRLQKNHDVDILSGRRLPLKRWPILWRLFIDPHSLLIAWFTLRNLPRVWREKYDIIIPLNGSWQPAFIRLVTWFYGGKMIIPGQSGMGWDDRNNLWSFPDHFIALSSKALRWAKRANPLIKSKYIPNGVDLKKFSPLGQKYKTNLKKPIVLCVGALTLSKRIDLTIRAVAKLKDASLLVVGDGGMKKELKALGKKLLGERFQLIKVPFQRMPEVYRTADIFTLVPKSSEAFGIVYVEAMASNLPVVAIDDEQRKEIVGNAGVFVDLVDIEKYSKALDETLKKKWGDEPRKQAEKFDWDKIAKEYEVLFASLLK
jgi:glycosyltransferase involved in cell wall biosynthesis